MKARKIEVKSAFEDIRVYTSEFKKHLLQYILLVLSLDLISQFIVIPLFRYVTTFVLQAGAIPFVSYQNSTSFNCLLYIYYSFCRYYI